MIKGKYRHEFKYLIDTSQFKYLQSQINYVMKPDPHAKSGIYSIRSAYFDDYNNSCFYDNEDGADPREKYRIRIYNSSSERISLECKKKENNKTLKHSSLIDKDACDSFLSNDINRIKLSNDELVNRFVCKILNDKMHPSVIVDYERIPYIYKEGNVRVTFDTNICSSNYFNLFYDNNMPKREILPKGFNLLEVKFDEFLPDIIYNVLQLDSLRQTNFSKYYLCRCFELGKNII